MRLYPVEQDVHAISAGSGECAGVNQLCETDDDLIGEAGRSGYAFEPGQILLRRKFLATLERSVETAVNPRFLAFLALSVCREGASDRRSSGFVGGGAVADRQTG